MVPASESIILHFKSVNKSKGFNVYLGIYTRSSSRNASGYIRLNHERRKAFNQLVLYLTLHFAQKGTGFFDGSIEETGFEKNLGHSQAAQGTLVQDDSPILRSIYSYIQPLHQNTLKTLLYGFFIASVKCNIVRLSILVDSKTQVPNTRR